MWAKYQKPKDENMRWMKHKSTEKVQSDFCLKLAKTRWQFRQLFLKFDKKKYFTKRRKHRMNKTFTSSISYTNIKLLINYVVDIPLQLLRTI